MIRLMKADRTAPAAALVVVEITSAAACDPDQEARAHVAVVEREPGYSITALRACPDRYCASFGRRLLIFGAAFRELPGNSRSEH